MPEPTTKSRTAPPPAPCGSLPDGTLLAVSPDSRTAYVTGGFTRDGHGNGITVVGLGSERARRLPAGERPLGIAVL